MVQGRAEEKVESAEDTVIRRVKKYACCGTAISSAEMPDVGSKNTAERALLSFEPSYAGACLVAVSVWTPHL